MEQFLNENDIIIPAQHGFTKFKSTNSAIIDIVDTNLKNLDNNSYSIGIFLDLSKAFDCVDHQILLHKLYHYGIRQTTYKWFESYLFNRM